MFSLPLPPCPGVCWLPQRPSSTATFSDVFSASSSMSWSLLASSAAFFHRDLLGCFLCLFLHVLEFVGFLSGLLPPRPSRMFSLPLPPCPGVCWLPQRPSS